MRHTDIDRQEAKRCRNCETQSPKIQSELEMRDILRNRERQIVRQRDTETWRHRDTEKQ